MIKTFFKLLLCVIIYTVVFLAAIVLLPHTQEFREMKQPDNPFGFLFLVINSAFVCFVVYFIIKNSMINGIKLFLISAGAVFFVQSFMTQIETLFFIRAFKGLTAFDVTLFMVRDLIALTATVPLMIKFFQNKEIVCEVIKVDVKSVIPKFGIIGVIYTIVYMTFGYFVAWQFEALRLFYSGSAEKLSFFGQLVNNVKTNPLIYPFQFIRGLLFSVAILPLLFVINKKKIFVFSVCLVYFSTSTVLLVPNALFPDMVRYGHLIEMSTSMIVFGLIVGNIMYIKNYLVKCSSMCRKINF